MNIKEAKEQIMKALRAYFSKDDFGNYRIPIEKQRPVFLMGPPGIGKTAIMEQTAQELGVALVTYSMTHHTRQSALGLPFIEHKNYQGNEYAVSEYTMSEIIASIYEMMEKTGLREGILFLDEVNCVSETLAPSMLQFLQYKVFGQHRVPDGWIVVTAGNPPEYNNSVREFDIVTWDRLKRVDVEADYEVWKEYAYAKMTHPAILTYLDVKKADFYRIESTVDGKRFVTARGWSDLSDMMRVCELLGETVDEKLIGQYLQNPKIAKSFAVYYDLFKKYRSDYQVDKILEGKAGQEVRDRAKAAKFDERLSLIGLLLDSVAGELKDAMEENEVLSRLTKALREVKESKDLKKAVEWKMRTLEEEYKKNKSSHLGSAEELQIQKKVIEALGDCLRAFESFDSIRKVFNSRVSAFKKRVSAASSHLENMFLFAEEVFENGQEMVILVTELTINRHTASYLAKFGCDGYFRHNKDLLVSDRIGEIDRALEGVSL